MKRVLVLGAGHSAPYLVRHLLSRAPDLDAEIVVGDLDSGRAEGLVAGHARGRAIRFDIHDEGQRHVEIGGADVVVHLLPPPFQPLIARECVAQGVHLVSASYRAKALLGELDAAARERGVTLLCEMGLDPGIDVMTAERQLARIRDAGGHVEAFYSYGGGLPEPAFSANPLRYCVTWNPRNVAIAAADGACYLRDGRFRLLPRERVFSSRWPVEVPGLGAFEAYANRDSMLYRELHRLDGVETLIRATLRYPGYCDFWGHLVRLGLPNEALEIPDHEAHSWRQLIAMCLPDQGPIAPAEVPARAAAFLGLDPAGEEFRKLEWLGIFDDKAPLGGKTPAAALAALLERKLELPLDSRDMVVLHHEIDVRERDGSRHRHVSTFIEYGDPGGARGTGTTAMARGVGLPMALGVEYVLTEKITRRGALVPIHPEIYEPVLAGLETAGMRFSEHSEPLPV